MSETPKKKNRRRRRPRRQSKSKNQAAVAGHTSDDTSQAQAQKSSDKRRNRRSGRRRKPKQSREKSARGNNDFVYQQHKVANMDVSPINKDIFIYTYTLRPQSLLDNYQVGESVVENMEFENPNSDGDPII